jgi:hypothetical protein
VVQHRSVEVGQALDPDAGSWSYLPALGHDEVDVLRVVPANTVGLEGGPPRQCRRSGVEKRSPGALVPRQRSSVVDVHAGMDARPMASAQQARNQQVIGAGCQYLFS